MDADDGNVFEEFAQDQMMALFGTAYLLVGDVHHAEALEKAFRRRRRKTTEVALDEATVAVQPDATVLSLPTP
jgi:hypothetical protein